MKSSRDLRIGRSVGNWLTETDLMKILFQADLFNKCITEAELYGRPKFQFIDDSRPTIGKSSKINGAQAGSTAQAWE